MISTKVTAAQFDEMCVRVVLTFDMATDDQIERGRNWYQTAHDLALMIGNGNLRIGAGVIAALSANKSWDQNIKIATRASHGILFGHTAVNLNKAERIMNGDDPVDVLPMHAKTGNFFLCILNPTHPTAVCVDRHAHDIAVGERYGNRDRGLGCTNRYNVLADVYRTAAGWREVSPPEMQARTWVTWLDARDAKA